jgi:hypothetical protein
MAKAATKSRLAELHKMFTEVLISELQQAKDEEMPMPAADKSVIANFLKANNITADADSTEMQDLRDKFDDELAAKRKEKAQELLAKAGGDPDDVLSGII